MAAAKRIAAVICSPRPRRLGPYITSHILSLIDALPPADTTTTTNTNNLTIDTIDLATQNLPMFTGAAVPASLPATSTHEHYDTPEIRAWSRLISSYDALVFVTPEYNAGLPAPAKNALDHLYHEWRGKPLGIVSYGFDRGGRTVAEGLKVSAGKVLKMKVLETMVNVQISGDLLDRCVEGGRVPEDKAGEWKGAGVDAGVAKMWGEMRAALGLETES